jgi:hypothetical protein
MTKRSRVVYEDWMSRDLYQLLDRLDRRRLTATTSLSASATLTNVIDKINEVIAEMKNRDAMEE